MEQPTQAEALTHAGAIEHWARFDNGLRGSELRASAKCLRRLHAENERLSALCDKWNSECDEFREDNKRLAAEIQSLRASQQAERAVPAEPVATIKSWTNGSYWRNYSVVWHRDDLPVGTDLYLAAPVQQSAPAGDAEGYPPLPAVDADLLDHGCSGGLLAKKHKGMRVDYSGLLGQCQRALRSRDEGANAEMLRQLQGHLKELGQRWYAGDIAVVDEILQLYCIEKDARAAIASQQP